MSVTITGSGFSDSAEDILVLFDDIECSVTSSSSISISCVLGHGFAGMKRLYLHILPQGLANIKNTMLKYEIVVDSIHPNSSGVMGGVAVVIAGSGFSTSDSEVGFQLVSHKAYSFYKHMKALQIDHDECTVWKTVVLISSSECQVTAVSEKEITCIAPPGEDGSNDVNVTVLCMNGSSEVYSGSLSNGLTYDLSLTPTITGVSPMQGYGHGGEVVTITGMGFSTVNIENTVMVS